MNGYHLVPLHLQLFHEVGFRAPKYAHIAPIMKNDNGNKRKLSKRKDPEAAVSYYAEQGIPKEAVTEYLIKHSKLNTLKIGEEQIKMQINR